MRIVSFVVALLFFVSCNKESTKTLKQGKYRATLEVQDNELLPFIFEVQDAHHLKIFNGEEVITVDEIEYKGDSVYIYVPYFETVFKTKFDGDGLHGKMIEVSRDRDVDFHAEFDNAIRFEVDKSQDAADVSGVWELEFDDYGIPYVSKGIFEQDGNYVTGTFRTPKGDYRFLEGVVNGDELRVSTFDGAHAFLFVATIKDSLMTDGIFYSGNHSRETFEGQRNPDFELPDEYALTYLNEDYEKFDFSFPDLEGNMVSLSDDQFKDKVVLVQIMGSYCPNCLDETKFYSKFYENVQDDPIEIIALAFENAKTEELAIGRIQRMRDRVGMNYPILLAQYGSADKKKAQEKLPMLNHVLSYPTTIYIDKKGEVRKIHTGFNGPATGEKYVAFQNEFNDFVNTLLNE